MLKRSCRFADTILPTSVSELGLIAGGQEADWTRVLGQNEISMLHLWHELLNVGDEYKVDFVIMDLGAGTARHTMNFFSAAHLGILTVLPEPTSLENAMYS